MATFFKAGDKVKVTWTSGDGSKIILDGEIMRQDGAGWRVQIPLGVEVLLSTEQLSLPLP